MSWNTLIDLLRSRAESRGERRAYTFLADGERESACWSYGDLDRGARAIAVHLRAHARAGDRVMLAFAPGLDFIAAFFGCLYAGVIAVPVPLPHPRRGHERLDAIAEDCEPCAVMSTAAGISAIHAAAARSPRLARLPMIAAEACSAEGAAEWTAPRTDAHDLALLQYTSGSTSAPKGVRVAHRNVLANLEMIHVAEGNDETSRGLSWLPAYHDMGLLEGILEPLYGAYPTWLMPPSAFLQRPARWVNAISDYGATASGAPDFAYDLCVRRVSDEEIEDIDLGTWRVAYNGAEPIRAHTMDAFSARFGRYGFSASAVRPVYGLAEATALVSASVPGRASLRVLRLDAAALAEGRVETAVSEAKRTVDIVSCGIACAGNHIVLIDPNSGRALGPGCVGEICVAGPSVTAGYWQCAEAKGRSYARAADGSRLLHTGDLGFVHEGELYVTGRIKDLVIVHGRKIYPHDVERTVEAHATQVCFGGVAAFAVQALQADRLVVVAEIEALKGDTGLVLDAIGEAVFREHDCAAADIVLVPRGTLPRTSSGKLMRFRCRDDYLANTLPVIARSQPRSEDERRVA